MKRYLRASRCTLLGLSLVLAACGGDKAVQPEDRLSNDGGSPVADAGSLPIQHAFDAQVSWRARFGSAGQLLVRLQPALLNGRVCGASRKGAVSCYSSADGSRQWQVDLDLSVSAALGGGDGLLALGSDEGELIVLDAKNGKERWRSDVGGEVLAVPQIALGVVVAKTAAGKMIGLSASDGSRLWATEQVVPTLTLRGISSPIVDENRVIAGFDNGKLLALQLNDGAPLWEVVVARPAGRTDLERLVDIDADPFLMRGDVYAVSYNGKLTAVASESGRQLWDKPMSSHIGLTGKGGQLFVTDAKGVFWAMDARTGRAVWQRSDFKETPLSRPAMHAGLVVVADADGVLYWLSPTDGRELARYNLGGDIAAPLMVSGDMLYVLDRSGRLSALGLSARDQDAG